MLTLDKIYHAKFVLKQVARKTDLIAATRLCPGTDLYLKTENLQVTGSFKVRGAYYKISQLSAEERAKGVIACSAGNHAQGVALAATRMGIKSVVCMPDGAPIMKVESTKRLGAEVELVKGTYDDAHDRAVELQEQTGMTFIHPYDDELVIAGQGTIGLEILDQLPDVDAVIVPIGGGGLISGVAFAIKSLRPEVKIYGVQAAGAPSMEHAFHDHKYETLDSAVTFADGIAVKTPGETTFAPQAETMSLTRLSWPGLSSSAIIRFVLRPLMTRPRVMTRDRMFTSMLPPEIRQTVFLPASGSLPNSAAATGVAPAPSATSFWFSISARMAAAISSSLTVTTSSTYWLTIS